MPNPHALLTSLRPDTLSTARELLNRARRDGITYHSSPADWRDELLYFLLPDRFSDGKEHTRSPLERDEIVAFRQAASRPGWNWKAWADSGKHWQGGTIKGIQGRLDYLQGLGITTLWIGPVFKQRARLDSYHGYGIQDFLDIDPRFGNRQQLIELVAAAHAKGMRVILDIIMNHSGDNWGYVAPESPLQSAHNEPAYLHWPNYYGNPGDRHTEGWQIAWRDETQQGFSTDHHAIQQPHDGVWPRELQTSERYTRAGRGDLGAGSIAEPHAEHKRTDFFSLKDFALDAPQVLAFLADCFKYWIALSDCDGFRIDTVKHISLEEARNFCGAIREFADTLGKRNFLLVGEIAGGDHFQDFVLDHLAVLQRNLSAALDIGSARANLHNVAKGLVSGSHYLDQFNQSDDGFGSHRILGDRHVSIVDDHDHVTGAKVRFSAEIPDHSAVKDYHVVVATAMQLFTLGIPCIYYGTEQAFAGPAQSQLPYLLAEGWNDGGNHGDRYLREAMFGPQHPRAAPHLGLQAQLDGNNPSLPGFGPFGTAGKHCFDMASPAYRRIAALTKLRGEHDVLRVGRQYPRQIRVFGEQFNFPAAGELVAWSRILDNQEALCIINPHGQEARGGDVIVAAELWQPGTEFTVVANTAHTANVNYSGSHPIGSRLNVAGRHSSSDPAYLPIRDVLPAEVIVLLKEF